MTRMFMALMSHETNTFSPLPTGLADFQSVLLLPPGAELPHNLWTAPLAVWRERAVALGWDVTQGTVAKAISSGLVTRSAHQIIKGRILDELRAAMPVDVCLLNLHGSMVADGCDDCEGDLLREVRALVGPDVPVFAELDLHAHLTPLMLESATGFVLYKQYPHTDYALRAAELFDMAAATLAGRIAPVMEVFDCRTLGLFPTSRQPMRGFVDRMQSLEGRDGVVSISLCHGYYWGDVADEGAKVLVVADADRPRAAMLAEQLGREFIAIREASQLGSTPLPDAIELLARGSANGPIVLSDVADGQGGGGPGDSTFILRAILERGITDTALAILWDPQAVAICLGAGEGAQLDLRLGGKTGSVSGDPLDVAVTVRRIVPDAVQSGHAGDFPFGPAVVLDIAGNDVIVSAARLKMRNATPFTSCGIDPARKRGLVLKGQYDFIEHYGFAAEILFVDAPGACRPDMKALHYRKLRRPMWPLDTGA